MDFFNFFTIAKSGAEEFILELHRIAFELRDMATLRHAQVRRSRILLSAHKHSANSIVLIETSTAANIGALRMRLLRAGLWSRWFRPWELKLRDGTPR